MAEATGFGIELEELRTMALVAGAIVPAMTWILSSKTGKQITTRSLISGIVIATILGVNINALRKE